MTNEEKYVKLSDVREMICSARLVGDEYNIGYQIADINLKQLPIADVEPVKHGKWIVRHRHEHYSSGKPYDEDVCPFCKRTDHNGDGLYCGYCGAKMDGKEGE